MRWTTSEIDIGDGDETTDWNGDALEVWAGDLAGGDVAVVLLNRSMKGQSITANFADIRHGLQPSQLEVAECFVTKGTPLKRIKPMARGR